MFSFESSFWFQQRVEFVLKVLGIKNAASFETSRAFLLRGEKLVLAAFFFICSLNSVFASESVEMSWDPSTSPDIASYRVYYGPKSGVYTNSIIFVGPDQTDELIMNLQFGGMYFFAVQATDANGRNSVLSEETSYLVPAAPHVTLDFEIFDYSGFPAVRITSDVVPTGSWIIETSPDLQTWTSDGLFNGLYEVLLTDVPKKFFRLNRL